MPYKNPEDRRRNNKEWREKNKEYLKQYAKEYRKTDSCKKQKAEFYQRNKEKINQKRKEYYLSNPEKALEQKQKSKAWREANPERVREVAKRNYERRQKDPKHQEQLKEYRKKYCSNPENIKRQKERGRKWYLENKERKNAQSKANYEANKEAWTERNRRNIAKRKTLDPVLFNQKNSVQSSIYRARKNETTTDGHTLPELHAYWKSQGIDPKRCTYCDAWYRQWEHDWKTSVGDHVIPITKGGDDVMENLVPCCFKCNASKGNRILYEEWIPPKERKAA